MGRLCLITSRGSSGLKVLGTGWETSTISRLVCSIGDAFQVVLLVVTAHKELVMHLGQLRYMRHVSWVGENFWTGAHRSWAQAALYGSQLRSVPAWGSWEWGILTDLPGTCHLSHQTLVC